MPYARYSKPAQDSSGNLLTGIWCEVRREDVAGNPLETLFADRLGDVGLSNPFYTADGVPEFFCAGGAFQVRYYRSGYDHTERYVGIGLAAESDLQGFVPMGAWDDETTYDIGDTVTHPNGGTLYLFASKVSDNLNNQPNATTPADTAYWVYLGLAVQGPAGPAGVIGNWRGAWVTATVYALNDAVQQGGSSYICLVSHTAGTFATDLAAAKWSLVSSPGTLAQFTPASSSAPAKLDLAEQTTNGTHKVTVQAPAALAADYTFTLPPATVTFDSFIVALLNSTTAAGAQSAIGVREKLTGNRQYQVGFDMGAVTISIASPAVVSKTAHGLVAGSRVSFAILPNMKTATISVASPAVVTMANSFAAGQPIKFNSTGRLPKGLSPETTYYVIATGLSGSSFQISATVGGAAINTSAPTVTISNASPGVVTETAHGRAIGSPVRFATTGALPTGLTAGTTYFVKTAPTADTYTVSATPEGAAINTSSAGSGTHTVVQFGTHYLSETGVLPTGITEGQDYYVIAAGLTANQFQFSATSGGAAVNTSGSTSGTIRARTGSDSATGIGGTAADALLTLAAAWNKAKALDCNDKAVTIQCCDGVMLAGVSMAGALVRCALFQILGNTTTEENCLVRATAANCFAPTDGCIVEIKGFKVETTGGGGSGIYAYAGGIARIDKIHFGSCASAQMTADSDSMINLALLGSYKISVGGVSHYHTYSYGQIVAAYQTVALLDQPVFSAYFAGTAHGEIGPANSTYNGFAKGPRYVSHKLGLIDTGSGSSATYFPGDSAGSTATGGQYL